MADGSGLRPAARAEHSPFSLPSKRGAWRTDRWGTLVCRTVVAETRDVKTFVFAPEDGARIAFVPGQFMTVRPFGAEAVDGVALERTYTLSSSAANDRAVAITVKRKAGGALSGALHDRLRPGDRVQALGPAGQFGPSFLPAERYCLVSAGSGITPMLSTVRTAADLGVDLDIMFVHGARRSADMIAAAELKALTKRLPRLRLALVPSQPSARSVGERGRIDGAMLERLVPDLADRAVLTCGPEGFMATVKAAALTLGVDPAAYAEESFDFGATVGEDGADAVAETRRITFARSKKSFDCPVSQTILAAAKTAGLPMPSSCAKGLCGTCKTLKLKGTVDMVNGGALRQREIDRGFILPCSARPVTDLVIDR